MLIKIYSYLQPAAQPNAVPLVVDHKIGGLLYVFMGQAGSNRYHSDVTQLWWFSSKTAWLLRLVSDQGVMHQALSPVCCLFGRPLHCPKR